MIMTKKEFKERSSIHVYGTGSERRVCLFFDWKEGTVNNKFFVGYKYRIKGYGVTKSMIFADAYDLLIKKNITTISWYDMKVAEKDTDRFKVPVAG